MSLPISPVIEEAIIRTKTFYAGWEAGASQERQHFIRIIEELPLDDDGNIKDTPLEDIIEKLLARETPVTIEQYREYLDSLEEDE